MAFTSGAFILFISFISLLYFCISKKYRWIILLIANYIFYFSWSKWLCLVLLATSIFTYLTGKKIQIGKERNSLYTKFVMIFGVFINLGILVFLKYCNFFIENVNLFIITIGKHKQIPSLNLIIPLGISFYTLQTVSYLVDIYHKKYPAEDNIFRFICYLSFFPQIVQGPISKYNQLANQIYEGHNFNYQRFTFGIQLIIWGFFKKLVIADRISLFVTEIFNNHLKYEGPIVFFAAICYGIQIYSDFSGGMDIARGISQIFGIELVLNFRQPYNSKSIQDFWRRWHITLGAWVKEYVFYPLSLSKGFTKLGMKSRKIFSVKTGKKIPAFIAMFIAYFCIGIWHGAGWKYIAYGIWNGSFIMMGILLNDFYASLKKILSVQETSVSWRFFQTIRTFLLVSFGRFLSRADSLTTAVQMAKSTFKNLDFSFIVSGTLNQFGLKTADWILLILSIALLFYVDSLHERGVKIRETIARQGIVFRWLIYYVAIFSVLIFGMYGPGFDSQNFIYMKF